MKNSEMLQRLSEQLPQFERFRMDIQKSGLTAWLVGGCVRDLLLDRQLADIDLVSVQDPTDWARTWAMSMAGHWFWLDKKRKQSRILLDSGLSFDFSPLRAATIIEDLTLRDFTINALALPISPVAADWTVLDPLNGLSDLHHRNVRICADQSLIDDPLRMLKGVRHALCLDFTLCPKTVSVIQHNAHRLEHVAGERIRDELLLILACDNLISAMHLLTETSLLPVLFGGSAPTWKPSQVGADLEHIANRIRQFEKQMTSETKIDLALTVPIAVLSSLLRHYQPHDFLQALKRLKLSRAEKRLILALQDPPDQNILQDVAGTSDTRRLALAVERHHPFGQERLFYWGWCQQVTAEQQLLAMLSAYSQLQKNGRIADLLSGNDFHQVEPTRIGTLQKSIKSAEIKGLIITTDQAKDWLKKRIIV